jgi:hypothetical protein
MFSQVPFGQPIVYKETAIGGFYGFTFIVFALLTAVMIVQLFIATQFSITQTISEVCKTIN